MAVVRWCLIVLLISALLQFAIQFTWTPAFLIKDKVEYDHKEEGTQWAVLVAGSHGMKNYRHQADVCHAYQLLKRGGLKEENIVVFMYDDIANHSKNPWPGIIVNHPRGPNVYSGVPKDYTGSHAIADNLYAVLLGDKKATKGGSGKVINSKKNDMIFIFYANHGDEAHLGMPSGLPVSHKKFIRVLRKKHAFGTYKGMVIYVEACHSGSLFKGKSKMLENLNIYAMTASTADENSHAAYCYRRGYFPFLDDRFCTGDMYSVAWMYDSEIHNRKKRTIGDQYQWVKEQIFPEKNRRGSHAMEYGSKKIKDQKLYLFQGFEPKISFIQKLRLWLNWQLWPL